MDKSKKKEEIKESDKYNIWKWKVDDEKVNKTKRKTKINEISERLKDSQIENLRYITKKNTNSKEVCSQRISERMMIKQRTCNPFLSNTNYLSDLSVQEEFLKPQNSNFENVELT
tara:strand:- start:94 stop:438 length:345 start_codon:yes stop_codon:yes gene_type:complete